MQVQVGGRGQGLDGRFSPSNPIFHGCRTVPSDLGLRGAAGHVGRHVGAWRAERGRGSGSHGARAGATTGSCQPAQAAPAVLASGINHHADHLPGIPAGALLHMCAQEAGSGNRGQAAQQGNHATLKSLQRHSAGAPAGWSGWKQAWHQFGGNRGAVRQGVGRAGTCKAAAPTAPVTEDTLGASRSYEYLKHATGSWELACNAMPARHGDCSSEGDASALPSQFKPVGGCPSTPVNLQQ
jgi:hypothetical protein